MTKISKEAEPVIMNCDTFDWKITQRSVNILRRLGNEYFDFLVSYQRSGEEPKNEALTNVYCPDVRNYVGELLETIDSVTLRIFNQTERAERMFKYMRRKNIVASA
jgi:hypothetical protein